MEYQKYLKQVGLIAFGSFILYLFFINGSRTILRSIQKTFFNHSHLINDLFSKNISINNQTNDSLIESLSSQKPFESRLYDYYPHLPIHIYTQNLTLIGRKSKLILLGNSFFENRTWNIAEENKSSTEHMSALRCPYFSNYCDITADMNRFSEADAVVYHIRNRIDQSDASEKRRSQQRFVFALWESPPHTPDLRPFRQFFNWTMSYRLKSHIVASYYSDNAYVHKSSDYYELMLRENATRKLNLKVKEIDHRPSDEILKKKKLGIAAALISNCDTPSKRIAFINELKRFINVEIYGGCGEPCPRNTNCRDFIAQNYYFILSFENSLCLDYTTEKFFASLEFPIVPVVLGIANYSDFIPSSGYIDTRQFPTILSLAQSLNQTRYDKEKYLSYFAWKKDYVWGLSQYFTPFCDLCLRLHLDSKPYVVDDIQKWWSDGVCQDAELPKW